MPKFVTHRLVQHPPEKMFDLVADVESYPLFLPMCEDLKIIQSKEKDGKTLIIADMQVGYKIIHETFRTSVFLNKEENKIDVHYIDGPFKYLENCWKFHAGPRENTSNIEFFIDYAFKNPMFSMVMGAMFENIFKKFSENFEKRADEIYKKE